MQKLQDSQNRLKLTFLRAGVDDLSNFALILSYFIFRPESSQLERDLLERGQFTYRQ